MRTLESKLDGFIRDNEIYKINNLLDENSKGAVSFWGKRVIEVLDKYKDVHRLDLHRMAGLIYQLSAKLCESQALKPGQRLVGIHIVRKLKQAYQLSDKEIKASNFFTRFLVWLREFTFSPYTNRWFLEGRAEDNFSAYSEENFVRLVGCEKNALGEYKNSIGSFGPPLRLIVKESDILPWHIPKEAPEPKATEKSEDFSGR